ncbi:Sterol desaturase/sphingolipid hydroxylase, fatty acid hydroxylase superfamily [Polynucleobacter meluiroseus]|uniref:Sterol desaturase/sphingolipid hydroxylase, fatty acid hydroxylase superfamily n=1 Tax=Polynucleobacter meluiroseus TaxID=1938814 RepID=A0A240DZP6_9BURK|nr:sterol desaturase family protein [Polynucleobacter meluiroseus]SNX28483.1 Sterol desaturase/sphingolipid hydroxylase, fatty acid hydroxylase superfamily [Polynucleobacter meluiroseus]
MESGILFSYLSDGYSWAEDYLFANVVSPLLYQLNLTAWTEDIYDGLDWFLLGCIQILLIALVLRTWERFHYAEVQERFAKASKADFIYTLIHRLGIFQGIIFIGLSGFFFEFDSVLHDFRFDRLNVESWWPPITAIPVVSFLIYFIMLDFVDYVYHRASHAFNWWWQLHALHHSQTVMTAWSDNRNHFLDDVLRALTFAFFALLFGVSPSQFILIVVISEFIQSWQHANIKVDLGLLRYLIVSPLYHRLHHAVGYGYEAPGKPGVLGGCNFGVLFPWWDMVFGTAIFTKTVYPTGVRNLELSNDILSQQWQTLRHAINELRGK